MLFAIEPARLALVATLCTTVLLAACVTPPPPAPLPPAPPPAEPAPPPPPPPPAATTADLATRQVLAAHERLRTLPAAELAREQARLGDGSASPQAAVELALLLVQNQAPADTVRALTLLDGVLKSPTADAWHPVARLLHARLQAQRRLEDALERQHQQARDTQRRIEQLNEKLEALKAIERSLATRPPGAGPAPAKATP